MSRLFRHLNYACRLIHGWAEWRACQCHSWAADSEWHGVRLNLFISIVCTPMRKNIQTFDARILWSARWQLRSRRRCVYICFVSARTLNLSSGESEHLNPPSDTMSFDEFVRSKELRPSLSVYSISSDESECPHKRPRTERSPSVEIIGALTACDGHEHRLTHLNCYRKSHRKPTCKSRIHSWTTISRFLQETDTRCRKPAWPRCIGNLG